jgi:hypothetical protein
MHRDSQSAYPTRAISKTLQELGTRPPWRAKVIARLEKDKLNVFHEIVTTEKGQAK